jgi:tetratricopeptide (TPR) repeat protein
MENKLQFVVDNESGYFVYPDERFKALLDAFDTLVSEYQDELVGPTTYIADLKKLLKKEPDFIDAHAHLSAAWDDLEGSPKKALKAALAGLAVGNRLIPEGFSGKIEWNNLDNRPFLRALHAAALSFAQLGRHRDSGLLMERLLAYNPDDNQGVRFLVGSELMRGGEIDRAGEIFANNADAYPPYYYELALFNVIRGNWVEAITALRKGFARNSYIAEMFSCNALPTAHLIWHGNNLAGPETAMLYMGMYSHLWFIVPERAALVRWLFNCSAILSERANMTAFREDLFTETDMEKRYKLSTHLNIAFDKIDDLSSEQIARAARINTPDAEYRWQLDPKKC